MHVEKPTIYNAEQMHAALPPFISQIDEQLVLSADYYPTDTRLGPYDIVIPFGNSREKLKGLVPKHEILTEDTPDITVLGYTNPMILSAMDSITELVNDPSRDSDNPQDRDVYRKSLEVAYREMAEAATEWVDGQRALVFPPKMGGIFVEQVFRQSDIEADYYDFRMSRAQDNNEGLTIGVNLNSVNPEISDYRTFVFADDCIASDISAYSTMEIIADKLRYMGIPLSKARMLITVSAASQRGIESLMSAEVQRHFGFGELKAIVGTLVQNMDDHYYLRHPDDRYFVGDMGNWTKPTDTTEK